MTHTLVSSRTTEIVRRDRKEEARHEASCIKLQAGNMCVCVCARGCREETKRFLSEQPAIAGGV